MNNKIEFTETAKNEINRILLKKSPKTYFRISVQEVDVLVSNIISHLTTKLLKMTTFLTKL